MDAFIVRIRQMEATRGPIWRPGSDDSKLRGSNNNKLVRLLALVLIASKDVVWPTCTLLLLSLFLCCILSKYISLYIIIYNTLEATRTTTTTAIYDFLVLLLSSSFQVFFFFVQRMSTGGLVCHAVDRALSRWTRPTTTAHRSNTRPIIHNTVLRLCCRVEFDQCCVFKNI